MIMIHHTEKLSNRKKIKRVTYVRARARAYLTCFFPKWPPKKSKKIQKFFFLFIWPKIHIYTKNEVFRYKTKKKTIWDCTLPLSSEETSKKYVDLFWQMWTFLYHQMSRFNCLRGGGHYFWGAGRGGDNFCGSGRAGDRFAPGGSLFTRPQLCGCGRGSPAHPHDIPGSSIEY